MALLRTQDALAAGDRHKVSRLGPSPEGARQESRVNQLMCPDEISPLPLRVWFIPEVTRCWGFSAPCLSPSVVGGPHPNWLRVSLVHTGPSVSPVHQGPGGSHRVCVCPCRRPVSFCLSHLLGPPELHIQRSE